MEIGVKFWNFGGSCTLHEYLTSGNLRHGHNELRYQYTHENFTSWKLYLTEIYSDWIRKKFTLQKFLAIQYPHISQWLPTASQSYVYARVRTWHTNHLLLFFFMNLKERMCYIACLDDLKPTIPVWASKMFSSYKTSQRFKTSQVDQGKKSLDDVYLSQIPYS